MKTLDITSKYDQYSDYTSGGPAPICTIHDVDYVAVEIMPRGFSNETSIRFSRADDADGVRRLTELIERNYTRDAGDGYSCRWLSAQEMAQHAHTAGYIVMASGGDDVIML